MTIFGHFVPLKNFGPPNFIVPSSPASNSDENAFFKTLRRTSGSGDIVCNTPLRSQSRQLTDVISIQISRPDLLSIQITFQIPNYFPNSKLLSNYFQITFSNYFQITYEIGHEHAMSGY